MHNMNIKVTYHYFLNEQTSEVQTTLIYTITRLSYTTVYTN